MMMKVPPEIFKAVAKEALKGAPGAWANGTEIVKLLGDDKDEHKPGSKGIIVGSLDVSHIPRPAGMMMNATPKYMYLIDFEGDKNSTFILDVQIEKI